jgi:GNAT superfamily N-acetyltransferase
MWRAYATSALRYPWTFVTPGSEAAAIWIPPGGDELTGDEARRLDDLLEKAAGPTWPHRPREIEARFEPAHSHEPFFHLTILATHSAHRGKGLGRALLAETLARIDAQGVAGYLESTNPANNRLYQSAGLRLRGWPSGRAADSYSLIRPPSTLR